MVGRLIEYQNYKEYTQLLTEKKEEREHYFTKHPTDLSHLEKNVTWDECQTLDLTDLIVAYQRVKSRLALNKPKTVEIIKRKLHYSTSYWKGNDTIKASYIF